MGPAVVVVTGPTATGKTALGVELARLFNGEVISADSMQLYRGMDIGTATPDAEEMRGVPHHLLSCVDPREDYSVSRFVEDAAACIRDVAGRGRLPFLVGGTGLYIDSLLSGRDFLGGDPAVRAAYAGRYDAEGGEALLRELAEIDPESAARLHPNDKKRVVRALEVWRVTGKTITEHDRESRLREPPYRACRIALSFADRAELYRRIDARVERMFERGLVEEVRSLLASGVPETATALQAIGYKEVLAALRGDCSEAEAKEEIQKASRRYAKRQLSWLSGREDVNWILWEKEPDLSWACQLSTAFMVKYGIIDADRH